MSDSGFFEMCRWAQSNDITYDIINGWVDEVGNSLTVEDVMRLYLKNKK